MRLTSRMWVSAHLRLCSSENVFAVVERRGNESAGAIFIKLIRARDQVNLYVPAPQTHAADGGRSWIAARSGALMSEQEADEIIRKEADFDPDLWVLSLEDQAGRHLLGSQLVEE